MLGRVANALTAWSQKWVPDAYVIAVLLTLVVLILSITWGPATIPEAVDAWGDGFWELLPVAMQMCLIMLGGYILSETKPVSALLDKLASKATTPTRAVLIVSLFSMLSALLNWGLSIAASAVCATRVGRHCPRADFRLLIACAYLGMSTTWHAGLSASAPLLVTQEKNAEPLGILPIPLSQTIFSPFNLLLTLSVLIVVCFLMPMLHPKPESTIPYPDSATDGDEVRPAVNSAAEAVSEGVGTSMPTPVWSDWLEKTPILTVIIAALAGCYLFMRFSAEPAMKVIDLNMVNFILLMTAILLHWRPDRFLDACRRGGAFVWGIIIQFPFYAGIYGIIKTTKLQDQLADVFVRTSSEGSFPLIVYWYSGIVNYFVPSGGSKWYIEAPYILDAGAKLGVDPSLTVLAYAWGDMMSDAIQPFWAIPLLALAGLKFRDIMGYLTLVFLIYSTLVSFAFWFAPRWFF